MVFDGSDASKQLGALKLSEIERILASADVLWTLYCGILVFFMQVGFTFLEAGSVRVRGLRHILLKNLLDNCITALVWFSFSYGLTFGTWNGETTDVIGIGNFFMINDSNYAVWFFQWGFVSASSTIVSGTIAERAKFLSYLLLTFYISLVVYPPVAHAFWDDHGFLKDLGENGILDFAGGGPVHLVGGFIGFICCWTIGPRDGRFDSEGKPITLPRASYALITFGVMILWFGWFGFNGGSTHGLSGGKIDIVGLVFVNTTISATTAGLTGILYSKLVVGHFDLNILLNSILSGLVSITPGCAFVDIWASFIIGFFGCFVYIILSKIILETLLMDDPVDAIAIHAGCGFYGLLMIGLFSTQGHIQSWTGKHTDAYGLFMGGGIEQLGVQFVGAILVCGWIIVTICPVVYFLKTFDLFRVDPSQINPNSTGQSNSWVKIELLNNGLIDFYQFRMASSTQRDISTHSTTTDTTTG